jgi:hypothetical protein
MRENPRTGEYRKKAIACQEETIIQVRDELVFEYLNRG